MPLPSRVIDVGPPDGSQHPRLLESRGQTGEYIALSHCWGTAQVLTTTQRSMEKRLARIPLLTMPKTFRDAVRVVRALEFRYLWIDSLCIIQDSDDDWAAEADQMGTVYQNATLTIAAVGATSASSGCFADFDGLWNRPVRVVSVPSRRKEAESDKPEPIYAFQHRTGETGYEDTFRQRGPLDTRGWVLQEEVLSPRILAFGTSGITWECLQMDASECVPEGSLKESKRFYSRTFKRSLLDRAHPGHTTSEDPLIKAWCSLIENYSKRNLTRQSDALAAVQGIASVIGRETGNTYLAGLWQDGLHQQLLWHVSPGIINPKWKSYGLMVHTVEKVQPRRRPPGPHRRPNFTAPSWSWATVTHHLEWPFSQSVRPLFEVLDGKAGHDTFSSWTGRLKVRGMLKGAKAVIGDHEYVEDPTWFFFLFLSSLFYTCVVHLTEFRLN